MKYLSINKTPPGAQVKEWACWLTGDIWWKSSTLRTFWDIFRNPPRQIN